MRCRHPVATQEFPTRPIKAIVALSAGGTSDVFIRALGEELHKRWGQPVIVENRPGGDFNIAARACAEAPPDGYTICILPNDPLVYNQFLFKKLPFDPEKDFAPITKLFHLTHVLVVNPSLNVKTVPELIALAKTKPLSYGTFRFRSRSTWRSSSGTTASTGCASRSAAAAKWPTRSCPDRRRSHSWGFERHGAAAGGSMTPLAVDGDARSPLFPDVPTLVELGHRDNWRAPGSACSRRPARPSRSSQDPREIARIVDDPDFRQGTHRPRSRAGRRSPGEFAQFLAQYRAAAADVVKEAGIEPQARLGRVQRPTPQRRKPLASTRSSASRSGMSTIASWPHGISWVRQAELDLS